MKLVILDRDGVINQESANFIKNPNEWIALPGSLEAIALLNQSGFRVALATNQSGVGRGLYEIGGFLVNYAVAVQNHQFHYITGLVSLFVIPCLTRNLCIS